MTSGGTLVGDWYHWGPSCDATDYEAAFGTAAVDYSVDAIPLGAYSDLPLTDAGAQVARGAASGGRRNKYSESTMSECVPQAGAGIE